jgi:hypothetical protein
MQPGTPSPPRPTPELIARFNALMDDIIACVTLEALRAAGVPWVVRVLLAPLIRRRIVRLSRGFSALLVGAPSGRSVGRADAPALDRAELADDLAAGLAIEPAEAACRGGAVPAPARRGDAPVRSGRGVDPRHALGPPNVVDLLERRAARPDRRGSKPSEPTPARMPRIVGPGGAPDRRRLPRAGTNPFGHPNFFRHPTAESLHDHFVTYLQRIKLARIFAAAPRMRRQSVSTARLNATHQFISGYRRPTSSARAAELRCPSPGAYS